MVAASEPRAGISSAVDGSELHCFETTRRKTVTQLRRERRSRRSPSASVEHVVHVKTSAIGRGDAIAAHIAPDASEMMTTMMITTTTMLTRREGVLQVMCWPQMENATRHVPKASTWQPMAVVKKPLRTATAPLELS